MCISYYNIHFRRSRIEFSQFLLETEKVKKNPVYPVNPVKKKAKNKNPIPLGFQVSRHLLEYIRV